MGGVGIQLAKGRALSVAADLEHGVRGFELRRFLEELCCSIRRFHHVTTDGVAASDVHIDREVFLGAPGAFADIRVRPPAAPPYFIEVKYGYPADRVTESLLRKFSPASSELPPGSRVIVLVDGLAWASWSAIEKACAGGLRADLALEAWNENDLNERLHKVFGVTLSSLSEESLLEVSAAVDRAKGAYAFETDQQGDLLEPALLWHLGWWRVHALRRKGLTKRTMLAPRVYDDVVVLFADLSGFSAYVRDTGDDSVVESSLAAFYAEARSQIVDAGGMLYQFLGDGVLAFFGIPDLAPGYPAAALECARALLEIGSAVSQRWQRLIDRVQTTGGSHIGMAMGDIQVMSLRPYRRAHVAAIGDCINLAARLASAAGPSEIVAGNRFFQSLPVAGQSGFTDAGALDAHNVGRIQAWRLAPGQRARSTGP